MTKNITITLYRAMVEDSLPDVPENKKESVSFVLDDDMTIEGRGVGGGYKFTCELDQYDIEDLREKGSVNISFPEDQTIYLRAPGLPDFPVKPEALKKALASFHNKDPGRTRHKDPDPNPAKDAVRVRGVMTRMFHKNVRA